MRMFLLDVSPEPVCELVSAADLRLNYLITNVNFITISWEIANLSLNLLVLSCGIHFTLT